MEKQKNYLQHTVSNATLLPIEQEMLDFVCGQIQSSLGSTINEKFRSSSEVHYDQYSLRSGKDSFDLKVNLSPDTPNFWDELASNKFSFHPEIVSSNLTGDYIFYCYKASKLSTASNLTEYLLSKHLGIQHQIGELINRLHAIKLNRTDYTVSVLNSFLPTQALASVSIFPLAHLFPQCRNVFLKLYTPTEDVGICHFDITPKNIVVDNSKPNKELKLINFEYAANANIHIDSLLCKYTLNASDQSFNDLVSHLQLDKATLIKYIDAAEVFAFCYFNSKILAEYLTFGERNRPMLKYWAAKSEEIYNKIKFRFFLQKPIDNSIQDFYNAWK